MTWTLNEFIEYYSADFHSLLTPNDSLALNNDILEAYGVTLEANATDLTKLHAIARFKFWERMMFIVSQDYDFSADGSSYSRSQMYKMAKENYLNTLREASKYLPTYGISIGELDTNEDPYIYIDPDTGFGF